MTKKTTQTPDQMIESLFAKLQDKKKAIEAIEKPHFKTNLSFGWSEENLGDRINIHTVTSVPKIVQMVAFLMQRQAAFQEAVKFLEVDADFTWLGFSLEDWLHDLKARAGKINIDAKRKEFKNLEDKLNSLVSPEQRRLMELEAITKALE